MNKHLNNNWLIELKDFDGYFVNEEGCMFSEKSGKMIQMFGSPDKEGYLRVCLTSNGKGYVKGIHRLITQTFKTNLENKKCVDHINRNRTDNRLENLRWVNDFENSRNKNKSKINTTGINGVHLRDSKTYIGQITDNNGVRHTKSFSINKHKEQAKQLAINYRLEMEQKYYTFN